MGRTTTTTGGSAAAALGFLADVADGIVTLDQLVQVPHSAAVQAQLTVDDAVVLVELLQGDADWCVVSYIGAG